MTWDLPNTIVNPDDRTAAYFNKYRECFNVLGLHSHSSADGDGAVLSGRLGMMDSQVVVLFRTQGTTTNTTTGLLGGITATYGAVGSVAIAESGVYLRAGTYAVAAYYVATGLVQTYFQIQSGLIFAPGATSDVINGTYTAQFSGVHTLSINTVFFSFGSGGTVSIYAIIITRTGDLPTLPPPTAQWRTKLFAAGEVLSAAALNQFGENFSLLEVHRHTGALGDGAAVISEDSDPAVLPQVQVLARFPKSTTGFTYSTSSSYRLGFVAQSSAQNDEIVFPVGLQAGTYRLEFLYGKGSNCGIATFYLDATSIGTIDTYNASTSYNDNSSISSITVATSAWYDLKIKMATKNGSSSGYVCRWQAVNLVRTGA